MSQRDAILTVCGVLAACCASVVQAGGSRTQIVRATYRVENAKTNGTAFVIADESGRRVLVTAAHTLEQAKGERASLILRKQDDAGRWSAVPTEIAIRKADKPLWVRHKDHDVAAIPLAADAPVETIPIDRLADDDDWKDPPEPGDLIHTIGFPHAAQFRPSPAGFPLTRLGCIASYPLTPVERHPMFLVDYNTFEGDSGGPVCCEMRGESGSAVRIIGLIHGQHFLDERYQTIYQSGHVRKRLGVAIVVNSQAILETIALAFREKSD